MKATEKRINIYTYRKREGAERYKVRYKVREREREGERE